MSGERMLSEISTRLVLFLLLVVVPIGSVAQTGQEGSAPEEGAEFSFGVEVAFFSDSMAAPEGGGEATGVLFGLLDLVLSTKLGRSTDFVLLFQAARGSSVSESFAGPAQPVSNLAAPPFQQLSEYRLIQQVAGEKLVVQFGKMDLNVDFSAIGIAGDFVHSSFGPIPTVPFPTYPNPGLGLTLAWSPIPELSLKASVADGDAVGGSLGFKTMFDGEGGHFSVTEVGLRPHLRGRLAGVYSVGLWRHTGDWEGFGAADRGRSFKGADGWYLACEQQVWRSENSDGDGRSVGVFLQGGKSQDDRMEIPRYHGGGVHATNLFGRSETLGLAVARAEVPGAFGGRRWETAIEGFVRLWAAPDLFIQPDLQFVNHPSGEVGGIWIVGVRLGWQIEAYSSGS